MINKELLKQMITEKLVSVQKHPTEELYIYNYSPLVQYGKLWNEVTTKTRGLILDGEMNIISAPFGKFFNLEEHSDHEIPNEPFEVFDKLDGSLGVLYWVKDKPFIATRGSFTSEQSVVANEILHNKYQHTFDKLSKNKTYLFEIIYPQNRIVVDYGETTDLILLTVICNKTRMETLDNMGFPLVKKHDGINDFRELKKLNEYNKEGFVIRFKSGFRLKIKFEEYVRLHRIITGVSNITVWEYMRDKKDFKEWLDRVPDEFYHWLKATRKGITFAYEKIENECNRVFKEFETRKETAIYFNKQKYPSVLYAMLDKKDISPIIFKLIKPKYSKPFKID